MKLAGGARFDCVGSTQEFTCYMAGLVSPGDHTCGWTTSTLHSHPAWRYWFRWGCGASSTTSFIAALAGGHIPYPRSAGPDHAALHPLRRGTPVTSQYTRYVAMHPLRRNAPDQKRCNAYRSGAPPPTTSTTAGNSPPQTPTVHLGRYDTASTCSPGSEREALHPWSSPVEWCNRFVSFGLGYALSWSGVSSCPVGCGVSRDLVRMSRLR